MANLDKNIVNLRSLGLRAAFILGKSTSPTLPLRGRKANQGGKSSPFKLKICIYSMVKVILDEVDSSSGEKKGKILAQVSFVNSNPITG